VIDLFVLKEEDDDIGILVVGRQNLDIIGILNK